MHAEPVEFKVEDFAQMPRTVFTRQRQEKDDEAAAAKPKMKCRQTDTFVCLRLHREIETPPWIYSFSTSKISKITGAHRGCTHSCIPVLLEKHPTRTDTGTDTHAKRDMIDTALLTAASGMQKSVNIRTSKRNTDTHCEHTGRLMHISIFPQNCFRHDSSHSSIGHSE